MSSLSRGFNNFFIFIFCHVEVFYFNEIRFIVIFSYNLCLFSDKVIFLWVFLKYNFIVCLLHLGL